MYVIFVDDTEADRLQVKKLLEDQGDWRVETCASLEELEQYIEGLRHAKRANPSIALLDMQLGEDEHGGLKTLSIVREQMPDVPAVIFSHSIRNSVVQQSYRNGAASYVQKPTDTAELPRVLVGLRQYWGGVAALPRRGSK